VSEISDNYLYIIIDCPPSLGILTINALICAQEVLVPVEPGVFPLYGLGLLQSTISEVRKSNPSLKITGVVPTKTDRTVASRETMAALQEEFGALLLEEIPRRTVINEAHMQGTDIYSYDSLSDSAKAYGQLVKKVISSEQ
jgi:chromosome partitioning protein